MLRPVPWGLVRRVPSSTPAPIPAAPRGSGIVLDSCYVPASSLLATAVDHWVEAVTELVHRLDCDLPTIQRVFCRRLRPGSSAAVEGGEKPGPGKVLTVAAGLSEFHHRGRSVIAITFESGLKLVYKPGDPGSEVAYARFLDWFNHHGAALSLRAPRIVARDGYRWVEYVEHEGCPDEAAVARFYRRAGMQLCVCYLLGVTDCIAPNLIASAEHPVLVDVETPMYPDAPPISPEGEPVVAEDSVLRTGWLPCRTRHSDARDGWDRSALACREPRSQRQDRRLETAGEARLGPPRGSSETPGHLPVLDGTPRPAAPYVEDLVEGFRQTYRLLTARRRTLLGLGSPLRAMWQLKVRWFFRPTRVYRRILDRSLAPEHLQNGTDWSIELEGLSYGFLTARHKPRIWPVLQAELAALERLDVPYFGTWSGSDSLTIGLRQPIEGYFQGIGYERMLSRLLSIDEADLARQEELIRQAVSPPH